MIRLHNALFSKKTARNRSCKMFSCLNSNKNSHNSSTNSLINQLSRNNKNKMITLEKSNTKSNKSIGNKSSSISLKFREFRQSNNCPDQYSYINGISLNKHKSQYKSIQNMKKAIDLEIKSYSQRKATKIKSKISTEFIMPTKSVDYRQVNGPHKCQFQSEELKERKPRRRYRKTKKQSITERSYKSIISNQNRSSNRHLPKNIMSYGSSIIVRQQQNNIINETQKILNPSCLNSARELLKQATRLKQAKQIKEDGKQKNVVKSKSTKRRVLTEISPKKTKQMGTQKQTQPEKQQFGSPAKEASNAKHSFSIGEFSSIIQINQSSFLSATGKKMLFDNQAANQGKPGERQKQMENVNRSSKQDKPSKMKANKQKKHGYFDENLDPVKLQNYRSIPISSITCSKKNIFYKNGLGKIKKAFPKGFFDG